MKTIVLFFVLLAAFAAVTAGHNKKQRAKENKDTEDVTNNDWPQPESLGEYGVPEGYDGPATVGGQSSEGNGDMPSGKSHLRSSRHHN